MLLKINGMTHDLWGAVDHGGEVLETIVTIALDRKAVSIFLKISAKRHGQKPSCRIAQGHAVRR